MAVRFVIGRAGSGKTAHCFRAIVEACRADPLGPPVYWILPKQATFQAERELTCNSGLAGFCRARVLSFEALSEAILAECGGGAIPEVTHLGRQMLLGHLLRTNMSSLRFFSGVAHQPGLAAKLDATFSEFERSGKDEVALATAVDELANAAGAEGDASRLLLDKLRDFRLLYTAYRAFLGQDRLDPHGRLNQMLACLRTSDAFRGATAYVDGFAEFTDTERRTLAGLAGIAERVEVALLIDPDSPTVADVHALPDELSLFHPVERSYRQLYFAFSEAGVKVVEPLKLSEKPRFAHAALRHVEALGFGGGPVPWPDPDPPVERIEAPDRRAEVDAVARRIRGLVHGGRGDGSVRLRDVAVLVRDLEPYHELIDASFREHGIPYFVDRRRTAAHHPLVRFVRAVLEVARHDWPHDAVMTVLKSGLAGIALDEADELENYVLLHRVRGPAWGDPKPWTYRRSLTRGGRGDDADFAPSERIEADRADAIRRGVVDHLRRFIDGQRSGEARSVRQTVTDLFALFERFGVRKTLAGWIAAADAAGELEQRGEHEQVWAEIVALFDQMVDLLGDEQLGIDDFVDVLETGLERFDLALTPPTVDQVLVGAVDRTRCPAVHTVFVLGLNDGEFPRGVREDSVLSDAERRDLRRQHIELDPETDRRALDERFLGYIAFTRAARRIVATRFLADDGGRPTAPSRFWIDFGRLFPTAARTALTRDAVAGAVGTPRQLVTRLMRWAREEEQTAGTAGPTGGAPTSVGPAVSAATPSQPWPALYQWLVDHACCDDAVDTTRFRAWKALSYHNDAALSSDTAAALFVPPLAASVTRMETFATCPFQHFARYGLRLREREEQDVTAMDLGNVFHQILERVVRHFLAQRKDWCEAEAAVTAAMIRDYAEQVGKELRGELMISSARNKYLLKRIERTVAQVVAGQRAAGRRGSFRPAIAELEFGVEGAKLEALRVATPVGREVLLRGKIDRVDVATGGNDVAVVDYKLASSQLALDRVYHGLSLQLLTYLLVLQSTGQELFGQPVTPAAAFYVRLLRSLEDVRHPDDALEPTDPKFDLKVKPRGIFDGRCIERLDADLTTGASDVVQVFVNKDGQFGRPDQSDAADTASFGALLAHVRRRIGELADEIVAGDIGIRPYRINKVTPCPRCELRSVCRFDAAVNPYHHLSSMKRSEVLRKVAEGVGDGG